LRFTARSTPSSLKTAPQRSKFLPGAAPPEAAPQIYRSKAKAETGDAKKTSADLPQGEKEVTKSASQNAAAFMSITAEQAVAQGILFAGNPDTRLGASAISTSSAALVFLTHEEAVKGIKMFAREVLPRFEQGQAEFNQVA
jgi:hypothetical protein